MMRKNYLKTIENEKNRKKSYIFSINNVRKSKFVLKQKNNK